MEKRFIYIPGVLIALMFGQVFNSNFCLAMDKNSENKQGQQSPKKPTHRRQVSSVEISNATRISLLYGDKTIKEFLAYLESLDKEKQDNIKSLLKSFQAELGLVQKVLEGGCLSGSELELFLATYKNLGKCIEICMGKLEKKSLCSLRGIPEDDEASKEKQKEREA